MTKIITTSEGDGESQTTTVSEMVSDTADEIEERLFEIGSRCWALTRRLYGEPVGEFADRLIKNLYDRINDVKAAVAEIKQALLEFENREEVDQQ